MLQQFRVESSKLNVLGRDVYVLDLIGHLDNSSVKVLDGAFTAAVADGGKLFILNLAHLDAIGSAGLLQLLRMRGATKSAGGSLKLAAPKRRITENILTPFGFSAVLETYATTEDALQALDQ